MTSSIARRGFFKLLGALGIVAGCRVGEEDDTDGSSNAVAEGEYDYIVIGSGAGGGPLACNLARSGFKVLLLEAGEDMSGNENFEVPAFHTKSTEDPGMRWDYYVDHYSDQVAAQADTKFVWNKDGHKHVGLKSQVPAGSKPLGILYPRAAAVGGCTAHNAMIMIYPHESDWQNLKDLTGDANFAPSVMRKYFAYLENAQYLSGGPLLPLSSEGHGKRGWLDLNRPSWTVGITDTKLLRILSAVGSTLASYKPGIQLALGEVAHLFSKDLNAVGKARDSTEGVFGIPLTTKSNGHRSGPADYIRATKSMMNSTLTLKTGVFVTKIAFEKDGGKLRSTGVHYREGKRLYRADPAAVGADDQAAQGASGAKPKRAAAASEDDGVKFVAAKREVIVACGAFNTPQLLKLSGIGPRKELEDLGIRVVKELPAVGTNLQDRYEVGIVSETDKPFDILAGCTWGEKRNGQEDPCLAEWRTAGKGVYTSNGGIAAVVKRSPAQPADGDTDLVIFALPSYFKGYFNDYSKLVTKDANHLTWAVLKGHTRNRAGTVTLRSTDPFDTPFINFHYFEQGAAEDLKGMVDGVKFVRKINDEIRDKFSTLGIKIAEYEEVHPKLPADSSDADIAEYVKREAWGHHASCTCPIGKNENDEGGSVLNSKFLVHGTSNLRVVDASVFPKIPGLFIVSAIYMISEKATDDILEAAGKPRRV